MAAIGARWSSRVAEKRGEIWMRFYIFLDFDGPLFNRRSEALRVEGDAGVARGLGVHPFFKYWRMDPVLVGWLQEEKRKHPEVFVVISSSWANPRMNSKEVIEALLSKNGLDPREVLAEDWSVYSLERGGQEKGGGWIRGVKIFGWLERNDPEARQEGRYVVLDDESSGTGLSTAEDVEKCDLDPRCVVLCDEEEGYSEEALRRLSEFVDKKLR